MKISHVTHCVKPDFIKVELYRSLKEIVNYNYYNHNYSKSDNTIGIWKIKYKQS